jgi:hypothetical protein
MAVSPYLFIGFGFWWTGRVMQLDWRKLVGTMEYTFSESVILYFAGPL